MTPSEKREEFQRRREARQSEAQAQPVARPSLEVLYPCRHRGELTGEVSRCLEGCGSAKATYHCEIHGVCGGRWRVEAGPSCVHCKEREV